MTGPIAIDESGDLGSKGTKYFAMAAIVTFHSRNLKKASKVLPKNAEYKWYNSDLQMRRRILFQMSYLTFNIVYTVVEKNKQGKNPKYGNNLYESTLRQVIQDAMEILPCRDVNILLDSCRFITINRFKEIVQSESSKHDVNVKIINKVKSEQNKCIQLADYVVGAIRAFHENSDDNVEIIKDKISIARRR